MTERNKGERVWVAVQSDGRSLPQYGGWTRSYLEGRLDRDYPAWKSHGITIRRATLIVDPVKPKRMTKTERIAVQSVVNRTRRTK